MTEPEELIDKAARVIANCDGVDRWSEVAEQEQVLEIVRAQNDDCVEQVDTALGHRYHTRGVHYSIPHVAEKAAAEIQKLQARIDKATALAEQHITFGPVPSPAANVCRQLHAALQPAPVHPGQDATLGPRHPAGSPEGHFPIRPQSTGQHHKDTPPVLPGDETPQPEEDQ